MSAAAMMRSVLALTVGVAGVLAGPRVAILGQIGGVGRLSAELWREEGLSDVAFLVQESEEGTAALSLSGESIFSGDFRNGLESFRSAKGDVANLRDCDSVMVAMDGGEGSDLATERELFSSALKGLPALPGRLCVVAPAKEPSLSGPMFLRGDTFDEAVEKAQQRGAASRISVLHHAKLVGPSDAARAEADLPFDGPPLVAPKINPASALGAVVLSGSRSPNPNPFVQLEAQEIYTTRSALAHAALYALREDKGFLADAMDKAGDYAEVTVLSILGPAAKAGDWESVCTRYGDRGPELLAVELAVDKEAMDKWMTTQYQAQALKGVALFADKGERPVNAKVTADGDVQVLWETLTDDLRATSVGSVCFSVKDSAKGVEVSATRRGPTGEALAQPLENEDDLIRSFTELLNKKFPMQ